LVTTVDAPMVPLLAVPPLRSIVEPRPATLPAATAPASSTLQSGACAIRRIGLAPNADAVRAFVARLNATPMKPSVRRSVIGAVMNALPRAITTESTEKGDERGALRPNDLLPEQ
jgi:hypothetical protein